MSFTVEFNKPEPEAPAPRPVNPAAMTGDERASARWQVRFVAWVVGLPSLLSIAFVAAIEQRHAWLFADNLQTWAAESAGLLAIALFGAGLPIAASLTRDTYPTAAKAAFWFWLLCVIANFTFLAGFAWRAPEIPAASQGIDMPGEEARELDLEIEWRRSALVEVGEDLAPDAPERKRIRASAPEAQARHAKLQNELQRLEISRYGKAVTGIAPSGPGHRPGLDLATVGFLMLAGSSLGLLISASSIASVLTEKAASVRLEAPEPEPAPAPAIAAYHPAESADGFDHWAISSVSRLSGERMRTTDAYENYTTFCARNDYARPLPVGEFGRRLRGWLAATYQIDGRHSNGTTYDNCTLKPAGHTLVAPAMNGGA